MIYLKRFCFGIIVFLCMIVGTLFTIIELITSPIWMFILYIITGEDPMCDDFYYGWKYSIKFLDWYESKFGPK